MKPKWLQQYNPERFEGKMNSNSSMGWSAENYLAALLGLSRNKAGKNLPDLISNAYWDRTFHVEVKESKGKGIVYPSQMFMEDLIQECIREGRHQVREHQLEAFARGGDIRAYYAFIDRLNPHGVRPATREDTLVLSWGDIYLIPSPMVKNLYVLELLRKRWPEITGTSEEEKTREIFKALEVIKEGLVQHKPGRVIMQELFHLYAAGQLGIHPEYFGCKKNTSDEHYHPSRFENILLRTLRNLFLREGALWLKLMPLLPEHYHTPSTIQMAGPCRTSIYLLDKDPIFIEPMASRIQQTTPEIASINQLRKIVHGFQAITEEGSKLTEKGKMQFEPGTRKLILQLKKDKPLQAAMRICTADLATWTITRSACRELRERIQEVIPITRLERLLN